MSLLTVRDIIRIPLTEDEIKAVMVKVSDKLVIAQLDNLRHRHVNVQFDSLLRGYLGEYCITKWLRSHNIHFEKTNMLPEDEVIDIDFLYKGKNIELKTSLVPDHDATLENVIKKRDIKLIRRGNSEIEELRGDIHLQIYYDHKRESKDRWLKAQQIDINSRNFDYLYDAFLARAYKEKTYFVAWIDKPSLVENVHRLPYGRRFWSFPESQRSFWNCKIKEARKPTELISYLKAF